MHLVIRVILWLTLLLRSKYLNQRNDRKSLYSNEHPKVKWNYPLTPFKNSIQKTTTHERKSASRSNVKKENNPFCPHCLSGAGSQEKRPGTLINIRFIFIRFLQFNTLLIPFPLWERQSNPNQYLTVHNKHAGATDDEKVTSSHYN